MKFISSLFFVVFLFCNTQAAQVTYTLCPTGCTFKSLVDFDTTMISLVASNTDYIISISPGIYQEQFELEFNYAPAGVNDVSYTFQSSTSNASDVILSNSGRPANYIIKLLDSRDITFKHITFQATGSTAILFEQGTFNTFFEDCIFIAPNATTQACTGQFAQGGIIDVDTYALSGNGRTSFKRCQFFGGCAGIELPYFSFGGQITGYHEMLTVDSCYFKNSLTAIKVALAGAKITNSVFDSYNTSDALTAIRIFLSDDSVIIGNNRINLASTAGANGVLYENLSSRFALIYNNEVIVNADDTLSCGLKMKGLDSTRLDAFVVNNSLLRLGGASVSSKVVEIDSRSIKSVLFQNNVVASNSGGLAISYIPRGLPNFTATNNLYFTNGTNLAKWMNSLVSTSSGIADWQALSSQDANSVLGDPLFASSWRLIAASPLVVNTGLPHPRVTRDINGVLRSTSAPFKGAYESGGTTCATLGVDSLIITPARCYNQANGAVQILASGGQSPYQYSLSGSSISVSNYTGLLAGNYGLTITDANNCQVTSNIVVPQPDTLIINLTVTHPAAGGFPGGAISANVTGGIAPYQYQWADNSTNTNRTNLMAGNYYLTVTDANLCQSTTVVTLINTPCPVIDSVVSTNANCYSSSDGEIEIFVSAFTGTIQYSINNGITWFPNPLFSNLAPNNYAVRVKDSGGCVSNATNVTVTRPSFINIMSQVTHATAGTNDGSIDITVTGGTAPYTYQWSNATTTEDIGNVTSGLYRVTITDANGCAALFFEVVEVKLTASFIATYQDSICFADSVIYTDVTVGASSRTWYFEGGNIAVSTDSIVTVVYDTPGVYQATLVVAKSTQRDTAIVAGGVYVSECLWLIPPMPTSFTATPIQKFAADSKILLTWQDNASTEDGFTLEKRSPMDTSWLPLATLSTNTDTYEDTGLLANTLYSYRLAAFNFYGVSDFAYLDSVITLPTGLHAYDQANLASFFDNDNQAIVVKNTSGQAALTLKVINLYGQVLINTELIDIENYIVVPQLSGVYLYFLQDPQGNIVRIEKFIAD